MQIAAFILVAIVFAASAVYSEQYSSKFDNIDIDEILNSERLLNNYFKCVVDKGPCTPDGSELKRILPDAVQTGCEKCTEKQKEGAKKVIRYLNDKKKPLFDELLAKYDPDRSYWEKYKSQLLSE